MDLSDAVETAFAATRALENVHIVQADIYHLPFPRIFDYAFSVGVLHHLPDPLRGFKSLASKVKQGGHLSAWVYGAENNEWITRWVCDNGITAERVMLVAGPSPRNPKANYRIELMRLNAENLSATESN